MLIGTTIKSMEQYIVSSLRENTEGMRNFSLSMDKISTSINAYTKTYYRLFGLQCLNNLTAPWTNLLARKAEQFVLRPNFVAEIIKPSKTAQLKPFIADPRNTDLIQSIIEHGKLVKSKEGKKLKLNHSNILLIGKPGTGKTEFAKKLGQELNMPVTIINGAELAGKYSDPLSVRAFLESTKGIIYINEADFLLSDRDLGTHHQQAIFTTVLSALNTPNNKQLFIVDTNSKKQLDPGMIRRFPTQVAFENPTQEMREKIIQLYVDKELKSLAKENNSFLGTQTESFTETLNTLFSPEEIKAIAQKTDGACGAHLENFVKSVQSKALVNKGVLTKEMIEKSLKNTQQVIKRSMQS